MSMQEIRTGQEITFGMKGSVKSMAPFGLDFADSGDASWTTEKFVGFQAGFGGTVKDCVLRMQIKPYIHKGGVEQQDMHVYVNGLLIGFVSTAVEAEVAFPVSRSFMSGRSLQFNLVIPTAMQPKTLGAGADTRYLGFQLRSMMIATI